MGGKYADRGGRVVRKFLPYIKIILVVLLLVFIALDMKSDDISNAKIEDVEKAVVNAAGVSDMEKSSNRMIKRFYGLNPQDYDGAVLYAPKDNMDVHEIFIVKLTDVSQTEEVKAAIEERLDTQKKSFEGYGAEQTKLLNDHVLVIKGNYIFYMVGENTSEAQKVFLNSL